MGSRKGKKDVVPGGRKIKRSMRGIMQEIVDTKSLTVRKALMRGIRADPRDSHHFLKLTAEYVDGKPGEHLTVSFDTDELAGAKDTLHRKIDRLLSVLKDTKT